MDTYMGTIQLFAADFAPLNWMLCDGQELQISQWSPLFAILGTEFGGDGLKVFKLPKLDFPQDPKVKGKLRYMICVRGIWPQRS